MAHMKPRSCFIDSVKSDVISWTLDKKDRTILLKMILEVCSYNEDISRIINMENSKSYSDLMFFMLTWMLLQKRIDRSNTLDK